jgi:hypothetical protein
MRILDFGFWMLDVGVAEGDDLNKKALQSNAIRNFSLFTLNFSLHNAPKEAL